MRSSILAFLVLLIIIPACYSQERTVDSLITLIDKEKEDTNKVLLMNKLAIQYQYSNPGKGMLLAYKAVTIAKQIKFVKGQGNSLTIIGNTLRIMGYYPEALLYHIEALKLREDINDLRGKGVSYVNMASVYSEQGEEKKALEAILQTKSIADSIHNEPLLASALTNGGDSYEKLGQLASARLFAQSGYNLAERLNDEDLMGINLNNLGNIYAKMGQSALALEFYQSCIPKAMASNNDDLLCETTLAIASILKKNIPPDSALPYAWLSLNVAEKNGSIKRIMNASDFLSKYYKDENRIDSAYEYQKKTALLKDSIFGQAKIKEVQNLIYIEQLRQEVIAENNRIAEEKRKENIKIIGIAAFIPLFFGIVLILSKRRVKPVIIEILGLLGLLLLFEFISLLIHPRVELLAHHNPITMLLVLVCIASVLIPVHHKLEEWVKKKLAHGKPLRRRRKKAP